MSVVVTRMCVLRLLSAAGILVLALAATGCTDFRKALGIEKSTPDEFRVVSRAPLSMPPDYGLKAPRPGASRPQETETAARAKQIVLDTGKPKKNLVDASKLRGRQPWEAALLSRTGAHQADPNIRRVVNHESALLAESQEDLIEGLMFWRVSPPPGTVVDAEKEARRLRENAALGRPATTGETPVIKRTDSDFQDEGILNSLF